ncbi:TPA: Ig-like domain-containing protein [Streptococcus suis]
MKKRFRRYLLGLFLVIGFFMTFQSVSAAIQPTDVTAPATGNTLVYVDGTFVSAGKDAVLKRLNEIRLEAYQEGYVSSYVPLKWSTDLEKIAQIRAAEATVKQGHARPNGKSFSMTINGQRSYAENLAWNGTKNAQSMLRAIEQFYSEKADYITYKQTGKLNGQIGHYLSIINPQYKYVGMGTFYTPGVYYTTTAQQFAYESTGSELETGIYGAHTQLMEVQGAMVTETSLTIPTSSLTVGQTTQAQVTAKLQVSGYQTTTIPIQLAGVVWSTGNASVAGVSNTGLVRGQSVGSTTITATAGATSLSQAVTVKGITSLQSIQVSTKSNKAPTLPTTVKATWSDGSTSQETVTWSSVNYSNKTTTAKTVTVTGTVANTSLKATATVTIHGISSLKTATITTKSGVAPTLPTSVTATWTDGTSTQEPVTWNAISSSQYTKTSPSQFTVAGTIQASSLAAQATVNVVTIRSATPVSLATKSGQAPSLPSTLSVTWSNGTTSQEPVTWNTLRPADYTSTQKKIVQLQGRLANTTVVPVATITVHAISQLAPVSVVTMNNTAPVLPTTVIATWTDGTTTAEAVTWDSILPSLYSNKFVETTFVTSGKVQKTNLLATATVTVIVEIPKPVYRLYHSGLQVHLYTTDANERTVLASRGWMYEGIAWKTATKTGDPVYRLYNPSLKVHLYTRDYNEYTILAERGWQQEGIAYRSYGTQPIYRLYHTGLKKHLYTKDANEYAILATRGWKQEGIAWYSLP